MGRKDLWHVAMIHYDSKSVRRYWSTSVNSNPAKLLNNGMKAMRIVSKYKMIVRPMYGHPSIPMYTSNFLEKNIYIYIYISVNEIYLMCVGCFFLTENKKKEC